MAFFGTLCYMQMMKPGLNSFSLWTGILMVLVLVSAAIFLIAVPDALSDRLYGNKRVFFIGLLLAYSIYRGFRVYATIKQYRHEA